MLCAFTIFQATTCCVNYVLTYAPRWSWTSFSLGFVSLQAYRYPGVFDKWDEHNLYSNPWALLMERFGRATAPPHSCVYILTIDHTGNKPKPLKMMEKCNCRQTLVDRTMNNCLRDTIGWQCVKWVEYSRVVASFILNSWRLTATHSQPYSTRLIDE